MKETPKTSEGKKTPTDTLREKRKKDAPQKRSAQDEDDDLMMEEEEETVPVEKTNRKNTENESEKRRTLNRK